MLTLHHALSEVARRQGERPALLGDGLQLSHAQLEACTARAAQSLARQGVEPGTVVGVSMATSPLHLVTLLALGRTGACSVHVHPDLAQAAKDALARQVGISVTIADPGRPAPIHADPEWLVPGGAAAFEIRAQPDGGWRIALSSGTTGLQKAILCTQAERLAYLAHHARAIPVGGEERFLCQRGLDAQAALDPVLCHLLQGDAVVFAAGLALGDFLEAAARHKATQAVVSPAFLRDLVECPATRGGLLPVFSMLMTTGSVLPPALVESAMARVTPNIFSGYGSTEMGMMTRADPEALRRAPGSVGRVLPWFQAEAAGEAGELRFRRAGMPTEYIGNPGATARAFRDGWFYTGDLGRIGSDGTLTIRGRVDDRINLEGMKIDPEPIERAIESHPAVLEAAAFASAPEGGRPALLAAAVLRGPLEEKALLAHCLERVGRRFTPARIFIVEALPRNERGKLLRAELARRVAVRKREG